MPKKNIKQTNITEKVTEPKEKKINTTKRSSSQKIEIQLIENLIELQKMHVKLGEKFDKLAEQISSLLALFEVSARTFAKQPHIQMAEKDKEFLEKIDKLLEQNKTIAKGLTLMDQKMREKIYGPISNFSTSESKLRPIPKI